ncbi:PEP-CTERM sorting domain-containing protein [uncultured Aquincola sp.]|uniref:PEP-CTERM sorting domain-containing protein n=1 Tax=uncultured Aquincola sp. TaxID=886556 RepID=UPI0032B2CFE8
MNTHLLVAAVLSTASAFAAAAPGPAAMQYETNAVALISDAADTQSGISPDGGGLTDPLISQATAFNTSDFASASALATGGLLVTTAEVDSKATFSSAAADVHFTSSYATPGTLDLRLTYSVDGAADNASWAYSGFSVTVSSGGATVFAQTFDTAGTFTHRSLILGADSTVDIQLFSEASTELQGGFAHSAAQLAFDVTLAPVPEPASWALALGGLGFIAARRMRGRSR